MRKLLTITLLGMFLFTGCSTKTIIKKDGFSFKQQKKDANKEWIKLDKAK